MRQPDAPIGCPSAIAPPLTLTFLVSQPICRFTAIACAAKASLISIKSRSFGSQPARDRQRLEAGTGPIPMYFGSTPAEAKALMRAMGFSPSSFAFFDEARTTAAAPSLMPEALPAVTLPFLSKAGLRPFSASSVDRKSTRLNSSHLVISYAVFCLKKKKKKLQFKHYGLNVVLVS